MIDNSFFNETTEQSLVKTTIVSKYFWAWAKVMIGAIKKNKGDGRIAYIDLFAGPGRYNDGTKSTPIQILEKAIQDTDMRRILISIFNDKDENNSNSLKKAIDNLPDIDKLKYKPEIKCQEVGEEIVKMFEGMNLIPTLFFVDPWGYKGLSLRLVNSVLKNWGCDCIFFFNYNRINMGLSNDAFEEHMNALFEKERADNLRIKLDNLSVEQREMTIVEELCQALGDLGGKYVLPFRFKNNSGARTSHHLIFVSKDFKGYEIMKNIMAKESSSSAQGVPSFEYNPATVLQPLLFELNRPLDQLAKMLKNYYAGQTLKMKDIYVYHNVGRKFVEKNYKDTLKQMEENGEINVKPKATERRKDTFGNDVMVTFPNHGGK